jgi:hypothetical protein
MDGTIIFSDDYLYKVLYTYSSSIHKKNGIITNF